MTKSSTNTTGTLSQKHPQYVMQYEDWTLMRDAYKGERQVKSKGETYLPATAGMRADGMVNQTDEGFKQYLAYKKRARFPNFVREAVQTAIGMLHSQPSKITVPKAMEKMVTSKGENFHQLLRRINEAQLTTGRLGLFLDLPLKPKAGEDLPYITTYDAETMINWDSNSRGDITRETLNLMVLDESGYERSAEGLTWESADRYRVLSLGTFENNEREESGFKYQFGVFDDDTASFDVSKLQTPNWRGRELEEIPFVVINSCDLVYEPDEPSLLDLGNLCMTIYRGEADYRQNLFMQGQDTFVVVGGNFAEDDKVRTGAGARLDLPIGGSAKFEGVTSDGLQEQRESLENDRGVAGTMGAQSLDSTSRERESGASLNIRVSARTADLNQVAMTGAQGLENILKIAARWMGENPDEVKVEPNMEWASAGLSGQNMVEMATARNLGYPISALSLHQSAFDKGLTKLTFEEEIKQAEKEQDGPFKRAENGDRNGEQSPEANDGKGVVRNGPNDKPAKDGPSGKGDDK